jgi:hypothetical protein
MLNFKAIRGIVTWQPEATMSCHKEQVLSIQFSYKQA